MIKSITVTKPRWLASSSNALFVNSNQRAIFKYDFDLNLLKSVNCTSFCGTHSCCELWGMYFNKETNELFIADMKGPIHVVDSNLNKRMHTITKNLSSQQFSSINFLNGQFLLGQKNRILVLQKNSSISFFKNICETSGLIDLIYLLDEFIVVGCMNDKSLSVLSKSSGLRMDKLNLSFSGIARQMTSDGKRLLITNSESNQINILSSMESYHFNFNFI